MNIFENDLIPKEFQYYYVKKTLKNTHSMYLVFGLDEKKHTGYVIHCKNNKDQMGFGFYQNTFMSYQAYQVYFYDNGIQLTDFTKFKYDPNHDNSDKIIKLKMNSVNDVLKYIKENEK